jgi:hypothetical protein
MRTSIISARNSNHKLVAPLLYSSTADTELVVFWVKQMLLAALRKYYDETIGFIENLIREVNRLSSV